MHLNRTADGRGQFAAGSFERNDDVIRSQLRIIDDFLRLTHGAEGDVNAIEDLVPMRHRLRAEDLIQNRGQLRHVRHQLRRIGEPRIRQEIGAANGFRHCRQFVRQDDENKPGSIRSAIHVQRRIGGVLSVVRPEELCLAQRGLDRDAGRPDTLSEERRRDVGPLAGALATIKRRHDRGIQADGGGVVAAASHRPGRRRAGVARHRQQPASRPVGRDVESGKSGVGTFFAEAGEIGVNQTRIPQCHIFILQLEFFPGRMRCVNDEHIGPPD